MGQFAIPRYETFVVTVTVVSGNTGTALFYKTGKLDRVSIIPTVLTAAYDIECIDSNSNAVFGKKGLVGKAAFKIDAICLKGNALIVSGPPADYVCTFYMEYGG